MADKKLSGLTIDVEVNVETAIKGLKSLQREAKETTKVLREMESTYDRREGSNFNEILKMLPTCELQRELEKREGVTTYNLGGYGSYTSMRLVSADGGKTEFIEGPAIITVNID